MAEPTAAETIPKTIIREAQPATPTAGSAAELAKKVNEKVDEVGFREGAKLLIKTPISESKLAQKVEQIGIERDDTTGAKARTPEEQRRYDSAKISSELTSKFIESGYDSLNDVQKGFVRNKLLTELRSRPALAAEMRGMSNAKQIALAERLLRDPSYIDKSRKRLEEILDNPNFDETILTNAQYAVEGAQLEFDDKSAAFTDAETRLANAKTQLIQYERDATGTPATGATRATEIDTLRTTSSTSSVDIAAQNTIISTKEQDVQRLERELVQARQREGIRSTRAINTAIGVVETKRNDANTVMGDATLTPEQRTAARQDYNKLGNELTRLEEEKEQASRIPRGRDVATIEAEIATAKTGINAARNEIQRIQADLPKLTDKEKSEKELRDEVKKLEEENREKKLAKDKAEVELSRRKKTLADATALRASMEQDLVDNLENVFESATGEWVNDQIEKAEEELKVQLEKLRETTTDNTEKEMYNALAERWKGPARTRTKGLINRRTETYRPIDKAVTDADYATLIASGPDALAKNILASRTNPATGVLFTTTEIDALIQNKEFMGKMQDEMVIQLLTRKRLTGGFNKEDIFNIEQTQWGKGMIDRAISNVDKYKETIEKAFGAGAMSQPGFREKFAKFAKNNPGWLLLLLGAGSLVAFGALPIAGAAVAAGSTAAGDGVFGKVF